MKKTRKLSEKDSKIFLKKLGNLPSRSRSQVLTQIRHNSDGSITLLDAAMIYLVASSLFEGHHSGAGIVDDPSLSDAVQSGIDDYADSSNDSSSFDSSSDYSSSDSGSGSSGDCGGGFGE